MITADEVKNAMIAQGIERVDHHDCGICGGMVAYVREGENLYFDPHCGCAGYGPLEPRTWEDAADWINMQNAEWQQKIAAKFGVDISESTLTRV